MATYKTVGIVLGRLNLGEADRLITFLTPDRGKIKAIAKGSRRIKSKLGGHLELFNEVDLVVAEGRSLDIVTGARLLWHQPAISVDMARLGHGYLIAELAARLVDEGTEAIGAYALVKEMLEDLEFQTPDVVSELYLKLRFLDVLGYRPVLDRCTSCAQPLGAGSRYWFNTSLGGVVDESCLEARHLPMETAQIKLWRLILDQPVRAVRLVNDIVPVAKTSLGLADSFYDHLFGRRFNMQTFAQTP